MDKTGVVCVTVSRAKKRDATTSKLEKLDTTTSKPKKRDINMTNTEKLDSTRSKPEKRDVTLFKLDKSDATISKPEKNDAIASKLETPIEVECSSQRSPEFQFIDVKDDIADNPANKSSPGTPVVEEGNEESAKIADKDVDTSDKIVEYLVPLQTLEEGPGKMK